MRGVLAPRRCSMAVQDGREADEVLLKRLLETHGTTPEEGYPLRKLALERELAERFPKLGGCVLEWRDDTLYVGTRDEALILVGTMNDGIVEDAPQRVSDAHDAYMRVVDLWTQPFSGRRKLPNGGGSCF